MTSRILESIGRIEYVGRPQTIRMRVIWAGSGTRTTGTCLWVQLEAHIHCSRASRVGLCKQLLNQRYNRTLRCYAWRRRRESYGTKVPRTVGVGSIGPARCDMVHVRSALNSFLSDRIHGSMVTHLKTFEPAIALEFKCVGRIDR